MSSPDPLVWIWVGIPSRCWNFGPGPASSSGGRLQPHPSIQTPQVGPQSGQTGQVISAGAKFEQLSLDGEGPVVLGTNVQMGGTGS